MTRAQFRLAVFRQKNDDSLRALLRDAVTQNWAACVFADLVAAAQSMPDAGLPDARLLDPELIVQAAEFGRPALLSVLTGAIPASTAQDFYDRALIGLCVNHYVCEDEYFKAAEILLQNGANPLAHDAICLSLSQSYQDKQRLYELFEAAVANPVRLSKPPFSSP